jgi:hypothetical protein
MADETGRQKVTRTVERDQGYRVLPVNGVYGTLNPAFGQMAFYYEDPEIRVDEAGEMFPESIKRVLVFDARMSPETFQASAYRMMDRVKQYEERTAERQ